MTVTAARSFKRHRLSADSGTTANGDFSNVRIRQRPPTASSSIAGHSAMASKLITESNTDMNVCHSKDNKSTVQKRRRHARSSLAAEAQTEQGQQQLICQQNASSRSSHIGQSASSRIQSVDTRQRTYRSASDRQRNGVRGLTPRLSPQHEHYSGAKFCCESPVASSLPRPPVHWLTMAF